MKSRLWFVCNMAERTTVSVVACLLQKLLTSGRTRGMWSGNIRMIISPLEKILIFLLLLFCVISVWQEEVLEDFYLLSLHTALNWTWLYYLSSFYACALYCHSANNFKVALVFLVFFLNIWTYWMHDLLSNKYKVFFFLFLFFQRWKCSLRLEKAACVTHSCFKGAPVPGVLVRNLPTFKGPLSFLNLCSQVYYRTTLHFALTAL